MKTTSYEISKKLKEARFDKDSAFAHFKSKCGGGGIFYVWEGIKEILGPSWGVLPVNFCPVETS